MEALGRLAAGELPSEAGERARLLAASADQLLAGAALAPHVLDAVVRAAAKALRQQPRPAADETAAAALRCLSNVAVQDASRVSPEVVDLVAETALRPSCVAPLPASRAALAACEAAIAALCSVTSQAAQRAGGLLCADPPLLASLLRAASIPLCLAAGADGGAESDPRLPGLIELLKTLHTNMVGGDGAREGSDPARALALCGLCDAVMSACEDEATRPGPHFILKNQLWRLLIRTATAPLLLEAATAAAAAAPGGAGSSLAGLAGLASRLFRCATARLEAQSAAAMDATGAEVVRLALFRLVQLRNLCTGYRAWLGAEARRGSSGIATEAAAFFARTGRRVVLFLAEGGTAGEAREEASKLLAKMDECLGALLAGSAGAGVDASGAQLLRGWAAMATAAVADGEVAGGAAAVDGSAAAEEAIDWLWVLLLCLRASCRASSSATHEAAAAATLPAALRLLPLCYTELLGPAATSEAQQQQGQGGPPPPPPSLSVVATLCAGYACTAPAAVRPLVLTSLVDASLAPHPLPRLVARGAASALLGAMPSPDAADACRTLLALCARLSAVGPSAARESARATQLLASLIAQLPPAALRPVVQAVGRPLAAVAATGVVAGDASSPPEGLVCSLRLLAELPAAVGRRPAGAAMDPFAPPSASAALALALAEAAGAEWSACLARVSTDSPPHLAPHLLLASAALVALLPAEGRSAPSSAASSASSTPDLAARGRPSPRVPPTGSAQAAAAAVAPCLVAALGSGGPLTAAACEAAALAAPRLPGSAIEELAQAAAGLQLPDDDPHGGGVGGGVGRACLLVVALLKRSLSASAYDHLADLILRLLSSTSHAAARYGATLDAFPPGGEGAGDWAGNTLAGHHLAGKSWAGVHEASRAAAEFTSTANEESLGRLIKWLQSQTLSSAFPSEHVDSHPGQHPCPDSGPQPGSQGDQNLTAPLMEFLARVDSPLDTATRAQVHAEQALATATARRIVELRLAPPEAPEASPPPAGEGVAGGGREGGGSEYGSGGAGGDAAAFMRGEGGGQRRPLQPVCAQHGSVAEPAAKRARLCAQVESGLGMLASGLAALGEASAATAAERAELRARLQAHAEEVRRLAAMLEQEAGGGGSR